MKVINHINRQNVISNKVNSIHMAANSQTYLYITVTMYNCNGDSTDLNSGRKKCRKENDTGDSEMVHR